MSRRKDREKFQELRRQNPDYKGFRGYENDPSRTGNTPLVAVNCSVCGKRRNVPVGIADEQGENYVCITCQGDGEPAEAGSTQAERA